VSVIDTATNTVTATVGVSAQPRFVAVSPDGTHAYVANSGPGTVSVIDTATNTVVENIGVGDEPTAIAIFPDGTHAYVTNTLAGTVSDMATTVIPDQGSTAGRTTVTLTGHHLANATAVHFGTAQAAVTANTATSLTVTTPAGSGAVPVTVTTPGGTGTLGSFYYAPFPALTGISPAAGPAAGSDDEIVITGRNLAGAIDVYFGPTRAVIQTVSDTQITVRAAGAPAPGGTAVTVITPGGTTDGLSYTYLDPSTVTGVSPNTGPATGGTEVTITGTGLASTDQVTFNGTLAPFAVISDTILTATTPPSGSDGTVDVGCEFIDVLVGQRDPIALGHPEDRLGFECAFQVEVELGFRQCRDFGAGGGHWVDPARSRNQASISSWLTEQTRSTHEGGKAPTPRWAPQSAPAIAATVSVSPVRLPAMSTAKWGSPAAYVAAAKAAGTDSVTASPVPMSSLMMRTACFSVEASSTVSHAQRMRWLTDGA
jgi:YVTN family beta-propeller protein